MEKVLPERASKREESSKQTHHTQKGFSFGSISPEFYQESALMQERDRVAQAAENAYYGTAKNAHIQGEVAKKNKKNTYLTGENSKPKLITSGVIVHDQNRETEIFVLTRHRSKKQNQSNDDNYATGGIRLLENSLVQEPLRTNQFLSERESLQDDVSMATADFQNRIHSIINSQKTPKFMLSPRNMAFLESFNQSQQDS